MDEESRKGQSTSQSWMEFKLIILMPLWLIFLRSSRSLANFIVMTVLAVIEGDYDVLQYLWHIRPWKNGV